MIYAGNAAMLKAVLDANVYVSAFTGAGGTPGEIWRRAKERRFALFISRPIVDELARILRRKFAFDERKVIFWLKQIARTAVTVRSESPISGICRDPDDDRILECAVAARADVIVTGDRDLLALKSYERIATLRPIDFLRILGK